MKTKILLLFIFGALNQNMMAQNDIFSNLELGGKAGINLASAYSDHYNNLNTKYGIYFGGFAVYQINDKISFMPELYFSSQGYKRTKTFEGIAEVHKYTEKLNYLNIPLLLRYTAMDKLHVYAGPQFGFLLSAKYRSIVLYEGETKQDDTWDIKEKRSSTGFDFVIGASYDITDNISADLRYVYGLKDIDICEVCKKVEKTRMIQIGVTYKINLK